MGIRAEFPVVNGVVPSWSDVIVKVMIVGGATIEIRDIKSFNSSRKLEIGKQRRGGRPYKRTTGQIDYESSVTFYRDGYQEFLRAMMAGGYVRGNQVVIGLTPVTVQVQHTPVGSIEIFERVCKGCRVAGDTLNSAEGTDADEVEVPFDTLEIADIIDGKEVVLL